jgi:hypothetical protein
VDDDQLDGQRSMTWSVQRDIERRPASTTALSLSVGDHVRVSVLPFDHAEAMAILARGEVARHPTLGRDQDVLPCST